MRSVATLGLMVLGIGSLEAATTVDDFGMGTNEFSMVFVDIGDPGNAPDPLAHLAVPGWTNNPPDGVLLGTVNYPYRIGKYEVPTFQVDRGNRLGGLLITTTDSRYTPTYWGQNKPATHMTYYEIITFVNWLNTSTGHHPAYRFSDFGEWLLWPPTEAWDLYGRNLYRHKDAFYFLPSADEWHKAAYYDPTKRIYYLYPTGSDTPPVATKGGTQPGTAVYNQPYAGGPADYDQAGGLSPYGTMGQGGNLWDWNESAFDASDDSTFEYIHIRGGKWYIAVGGMKASFGDDPYYPWGYGDCCTFRVAALPELVGDSDGDGLGDQQEYICGTNPFDAASVLRLAVVDHEENVELQVHTIAAPSYGYMDPRRYYSIEHGNGDGGWEAAAACDRVLGTNQVLSCFIPKADPAERFFRVRAWLEAGAMPQPDRGIQTVDRFGPEDGGFALTFVEIGDPGNAKDPAATPFPLGAVGYRYRVSKYEIPEDAVTRANTLGGLGVTFSALGPKKPVTTMNFTEIAKFVNWLNTVTGHHVAYNIDSKGKWQLWSADEAWQDGGQNLYRHKDAFYFVPSADEWYKAAAFDGTRYYQWGAQKDTESIPVPAGQIGGTAVYAQPRDQGPADIDQAGGLSFYGTMGQTGNVREQLETARDGVNDSVNEIMLYAGGGWFDLHVSPRTTSGEFSSNETNTRGFRIAARLPAGR